MILAGDIGGTKTRLALFAEKDTQFFFDPKTLAKERMAKKTSLLKVSLIKEKEYSSTSWNTLEDVLQEFLNDSGVSRKEIQAGCLSLAGPIQEHTCRLVNLGKTIDLEKLKDTFKFQVPLTFCNDLVATGQGIFTLEPKDFFCLNPESHSKLYGHLSNMNPPNISPVNSSSLNTDPLNTSLSYPYFLNTSPDPMDPITKERFLNRAVIAPGTGLGESIILRKDLICPTEGAHCDFAPRTEREVRLWRFLHKQYGHVSYERVLSGPGLVNIYSFLLSERCRTTSTSSLLTPEEISAKALAGSCPVCAEALDLFVQILSAEAGNLALKSLALGGIYLGGGIPPKILPKLQDGSFLRSFQDKGRFSGLVAEIPVYVILNEKAALYGAAMRAISYNTDPRKGSPLSQT